MTITFEVRVHNSKGDPYWSPLTSYRYSGTTPASVALRWAAAAFAASPHHDIWLRLTERDRRVRA